MLIFTAGALLPGGATAADTDAAAVAAAAPLSSAAGTAVVDGAAAVAGCGWCGAGVAAIPPANIAQAQLSACFL